ITGCTSIDSAEVFINQNALGYVFVTVVDENCTGENNGMIEVTDISGGIPPYSYSLNSLMDNSTGQFDSLASGGYNLHIIDAFGCALDTFFIIQPGIHLELALPEFIQLHEDQTGFIQATVNVPVEDLSSIQWNPSGILSCDTCLSTMIMTHENQLLQLIIVHINGCVDTAELNITVFPTQKFYIPNTFSPNGDGFNDFFTLYSNDGVESILEINIFDRWGEYIYQAKNISPNNPELGWDGRFHHQEMPSGTFVYYIKLLLSDGTEKTVTGDVTLVK
ncbi:MAG: gliding motility-associated C-terminal domain-containing protein, partial [Saprospiraceae bacterium]